MTNTLEQSSGNRLAQLNSMFLDSLNKISDIINKFGGNAIIQGEHYSKILLYFYQTLILDILPGLQLLVYNNRLISFSILCRTMLDSIIQIMWIKNSPGNERKQAIEFFCEFDGHFETTKNKKKYTWQEKFYPNYKSREEAIRLGIDEEIIDWPGGEKLTSYDYFSKIAHLNPKLLKDMIGTDQNNRLGFTMEYIRMATISTCGAISYIIAFVKEFIEHLYKENSTTNESIKELSSICVEWKMMKENILKT